MPSGPSGRQFTVPPPDASAEGAIVLEPPRRFGRYVIVGRIARGGMATVHLARQRSGGGFEKWVALKVVHPHLADDAQFVQMFLNEARLVARLDHPNICTVFDFGESDGTFYLAMEYLQGQPLTAVLRRGAHAGRPLPPHLGARVVADAARGLHAAHELAAEDGRRADVVHRDVSPQNLVVLYNGATKVLDFGIARSREHMGEQTATGVVKGKVAYMAPEQVRGEPLDRRADVFALGVVLWETTTQRRLFKRDNDAATVAAVLTEPVPPPSTLVPGYPEDLEHLVMCALSRDPAERFQTADAMARALESFLATCGAPASSVHVGDAMRALFSEQLAAQSAATQRAAEAARAFDAASPDDSYPSGAFRTPLPAMRTPTPPGGTRATAPPAPIAAAGMSSTGGSGGSETAPAITLGAAQLQARQGGAARRGWWRPLAFAAVLVSAGLGLGLWARARSDRLRAASAGSAAPARPAPGEPNSTPAGPPPDTQLHALTIPVGAAPLAVPPQRTADAEPAAAAADASVPAAAARASARRSAHRRAGASGAGDAGAPGSERPARGHGAATRTPAAGTNGADIIE